MIRVHFTTGDLARTRLVPTFGPYAEALFSLGVLRDRQATAVLFTGWFRHLAPDHQAWAAPLGQVVGSPPVLDLFSLVGAAAGVDEVAEAVLGLPSDDLRDEVSAAAGFAAAYGSGGPRTLPPWAFQLADDRQVRAAFVAMIRASCAAVTGTGWARIHTHLDAEVAAQSGVAAQGGLERLFPNLDPDLAWRDGVLFIDNRRHCTDVHLNGRGLALVPSVFCRRMSSPYLSLAHEDQPAVLFYPALRDIVDSYRLWAPDPARSTHHALVALLGATRAAALDLVGANGRCTTELAHHLGVSMATASYHATVLRNAGLITSRRHGSMVVHTVTDLGTRLLNGDVGTQGDCPPGT